MLMTATAVKWTNLGNCMPRGSKTMDSNQLLCGRGIPCEDVGLEKGIFLKLYLADYNYIPKFILEMYEDMYCMHRILHVGKNSDNYTFIMYH